MTFDIDLYKVKALTLPHDFPADVCTGEENIICGFLYHKENYVFIKNETEDTWVNPYTICRNTGVKENGVYLYEFDLLRCKRGCGEELGIIIFDNFNKAWAIQSNNNHTGRSSLKSTNIISVIGNVLLSKEDADTFQEYSDDEDAKYTGIRSEPECRSTAHVNKLAKQFLPR